MAVRDAPAATLAFSGAANQPRSRERGQANFSQPSSAALAAESNGITKTQGKPMRRMVNPQEFLIGNREPGVFQAHQCDVVNKRQISREPPTSGDDNSRSCNGVQHHANFDALAAVLELKGSPPRLRVSRSSQRKTRAETFYPLRSAASTAAASLSRWRCSRATRSAASRPRSRSS